MVLLQITGAAHIPWQDPRWQELLHGYSVWVHLELLHEDDGSCLAQACNSLLSHAPRTSNLAALTLHVTRMLRDVLPSPTNNDDDAAEAAVQAFSDRIALVGKARAVAGALNLLRILCHAVLVHASTKSQEQAEEYLEACFTYTSRGDSSREIDTATDLVSAAFQFLVSDPTHWTKEVPELYDTTVLCLELILVLFSSQLYQPMISSFQVEENSITPPATFFWDCLIDQALDPYQPPDKSSNHQQSSSKSTSTKTSWTPQSILLTCLEWQMTRPKGPEKSIAHHISQLALSVVQAKGEKQAADGMYENHQIVMATAPQYASGEATGAGPEDVVRHSSATSSSSKLILDATKGVLVLSSKIILLPFRLMSLAFGLWGHKEKGYDEALKKQYQSQLWNGTQTPSPRHQHQKQQFATKDALWLSDSIVADLATSLFLLLVNNGRARGNPFRQEVESLSDNRWETDGSAFPDLPALVEPTNSQEEQESLLQPSGSNGSSSPTTKQRQLTSRRSKNTSALVNFESLFESFSAITHTEIGALQLYTILQASRAFAESVAVRSDLDALILPLLRTLYFASSSRHFISTESKGGNKLSIRNCPFRSPSQLYVIIILLLLFSQDSSFGSDAFRRIKIPIVPFYKERNLKEISLGSLLILSLLRNLTFNINRLHDPFLLSNCCAVLMNLSNSVVDLHDYAAMRLVSVTTSTMKKFSNLHKANPNAVEKDPASETAMYGEVSRTLLRVLRQCLSPKLVEGNLHLVYALVYYQTDFKRATAMEGSPFRPGEVKLIDEVTNVASSVIEKNGARAAAMALKVLSSHSKTIKEASTTHSASKTNGKSKTPPSPSDGDPSEDFMFTYEEEHDPEVFFVPYLWEVIVCTVTSGLIGWRKKNIQVFPLLDDDEPLEECDHSDLPQVVAQGFAKDVSDIV